MNTPLGLRPISELAVGELVLSFDVSQRRLVERKISRVFRHGPQKFGAFAGTGLTGVTPNHPVFDASRGLFLEAGKLTHESEALRLVDGAITTTKGGRYRPSADAPEPVFNLSVTETQTYFAEGILVHNKEPILPSPPSVCRMDGFTPQCGESYEEYLARDHYLIQSQEAVCEGVGGAGGAAPPAHSDCAAPQRDAYLQVLGGDEGCGGAELWVESSAPIRVSIYEIGDTCDLSGVPLSSVSVDVPTAISLPLSDQSFWVHLEPLDQTPLVADVRLTK